MSEVVTLCPQCGPNVGVDEDGCCTTCGADATGPGVEYAESLRSALTMCLRWLEAEVARTAGSDWEEIHGTPTKGPIYEARKALGIPQPTTPQGVIEEATG
jgi:hypothetical protein